MTLTAPLSAVARTVVLVLLVVTAIAARRPLRPERLVKTNVATGRTAFLGTYDDTPLRKDRRRGEAVVDP